MANAGVRHAIIVGPQGAGKGTQASRVAPKFGLTHVATGDIFRSVLKSETELSQEVRSYYDAGSLVPDELTIRVLFNHIDNLSKQDPGYSGALLDGFPRNQAQATALDEALAERNEPLAAVIHVVVPREVLMERLTGRLICSNCGETYHTAFNPPEKAGTCDRCGHELYQRTDDTPEAVERRLAIYFEQTEPILDHYRNMGVLYEIDGNQDIDAVETEILSTVGPAFSVRP